MRKTRILLLMLMLISILSLINLTKANGSFTNENFTTYTETDPNSHITITDATHITFVAYENEEARIYKEKGVNHFSTDFKQKVDARFIEYAMVNKRGGFWALTNDVDDLKGLRDGDKDYLAATFRIFATGSMRLYIEEGYEGSVAEDYVAVSNNTWYYLLIERASSNFTCKIYTNASQRDVEGPPDVDTLSIALQAVVPYRYIFASITYNSGTSVSFSMYVATLALEYSYQYTLKGVYEEESGDWLGTAVNVTVYFTTIEGAFTFEVNGAYVYRCYQKPEYFRFNTTSPREYWLSDTEDTATIYIFDDTRIEYALSFLDFAGVLDDAPYVEAKFNINGSKHIVEKRKVDATKAVVMNLVSGRRYEIHIRDGDSSYTYGDLYMPSTTTTLQLTLKGLEFPQNIILGYRYMRIYGTRVADNPIGNITITYEDTLDETTSVTFYIKYNNGTNAYNATETANSFQHIWTSAVNDTDYYLVATITHQTLGTITWKQYFPKYFSEPPWSLTFLGTLPFASSTLIPALIIIFVAGCFSVINAEVGAFFATVTAIILTYFGWISIPIGSLVTAFCFALLMAIIYSKRTVQT